MAETGEMGIVPYMYAQTALCRIGRQNELAQLGSARVKGLDFKAPRPSAEMCNRVKPKVPHSKSRHLPDLGI